jgi:hypothetical protein
MASRSGNWGVVCSVAEWFSANRNRVRPLAAVRLGETVEWDESALLLLCCTEKQNNDQRANMSDVYVQKVDTRYRLPHSLQAEQRRLDQLTRSVVEIACTQAITRLGLSEDSELCLRNVFVPVSLRLSEADKSLVDKWSAVLADEIAETIRRGSTRLAVVYQSRRQALIDLVQSVAQGDLRRRWAWRQLGLWQSAGEPSERLAFVELVRALCDQAEMIVPVFSALVASGELPHIARRLTQEQWQALAGAALFEHHASDFLDQPGVAFSSSVAREVWRVIERSSIFRSVASSLRLAETSESIRRSIAVLAVLEVKPLLIRSKSAAMLINGIVEVTSSRPQILSDAATDEANTSQVSRSASAGSKIVQSDTVGPVESARHLAGTEQSHVGGTEQSHVAQSHVGGSEQSFDTHAESWSERREERKPLDLRQRACTRFGGLLFLIPVLEDLNIPELILEHSVLGERDFQWVLHQLAQAILELAPGDPAALAFAGLAPNAKPPSVDESVASDDETTSLRELVARISERLHSLLELDAETDVIEFVCLRHAEVVADPGWIEVRLSLDEVSPEIRRAGLDLDPGYVSWLGVVVKFIYE